MSFRSSFLIVWAALTAFVTLAGTCTLLAQSILAGSMPTMPDFTRTAVIVLGSGLLLALATLYFRVFLSADGLRCYDFNGIYQTARWDAITEAIPFKFFGLRYLRVFSNDTKRPRYVPLFLSDMPGFTAAVIRLAGPDHLLAKALAKA